ncbi:MAG: ribosomal protein S18-alanine N-acetyltransferase [Firmicutes bacterium]|nr:ribosomal protein S18-alanine N-acetyltransferase [Bacillota bacterium]
MSRPFSKDEEAEGIFPAPEIVVDFMRVADVNAVWAIEKLSFSAPWSRSAFQSELLENDKAVYLVARLGRKIIGYIGMWIVLDEGHITNLAVHPGYRSRGIGRQLLEAMSELGRMRGVRRLTLEVRMSNIIAQQLYVRTGFVASGIRPRYYHDNNEDALIMWKENV